MEKVSPCTPFKNFLTKKEKGIEDTDRHKGIAYLLSLLLCLCRDRRPRRSEKTTEYRKQKRVLANRPKKSSNTAYNLSVEKTIGCPLFLHLTLYSFCFCGKIM